MKNNSEYSAIIIGAGVATGSALTKKFAKEGYKVCPVRRGTNASDLKDLEDEIKQDGGSVSYTHLTLPTNREV